MRRAPQFLFLLVASAFALAIFVLDSRKPIFAPLPEQADRIASARALTLWRSTIGSTPSPYRVALGRGGLEPKSRAGDNRAPEGLYPITSRNVRSAFHRSLHIGYPTEQQRGAAAQRSVDPGGDIMIHGIRKGLGWLGVLHREIDWTKGCIAVTNAEMDQVCDSVPVGTQVQILP